MREGESGGHLPFAQANATARIFPKAEMATNIFSPLVVNSLIPNTCWLL